MRFVALLFFAFVLATTCAHGGILGPHDVVLLFSPENPAGETVLVDRVAGRYPVACVTETAHVPGMPPRLVPEALCLFLQDGREIVLVVPIYPLPVEV